MSIVRTTRPQLGKEGDYGSTAHCRTQIIRVCLRKDPCLRRVEFRGWMPVPLSAPPTGDLELQ